MTDPTPSPGDVTTQAEARDMALLKQQAEVVIAWLDAEKALMQRKP